MRRQIIVFFASLIWLFSPAAFAAERGAMFKVTGHGHSMVLFGTMHVGLAEFYPLEPRIVQAVAAASTLALELDPAIAPQAAAAAMREHGLARAGSTLPPALSARLAPLLRQAGMDPAALAHLKPWLVAMVLALHEFGVQGFRADLSVDSHLAALARSGKAKVMQLESAALQMGLFSKLSEAGQLHYLEDAIALIESGKHRAEIRAVTDAWRSADRAALDAIALRVETDTTFSGRFMREVVLDERNVALADKLLQLLKRENNAVAAIGVLHLLGANSVPALMRAKGVTVERVY